MCLMLSSFRQSVHFMLDALFAELQLALSHHAKVATPARHQQTPPGTLGVRKPRTAERHNA